MNSKHTGFFLSLTLPFGVFMLHLTCDEYEENCYFWWWKWTFTTFKGN